MQPSSAAGYGQWCFQDTDLLKTGIKVHRNISDSSTDENNENILIIHAMSIKCRCSTKIILFYVKVKSQMKHLEMNQFDLNGNNQTF